MSVPTTDLSTRSYAALACPLTKPDTFRHSYGQELSHKPGVVP